MRLLWLTYERPPHRDAVSHPIDTQDAEFVVALLSLSYTRRVQLTGQLVRYLDQDQSLPIADRRSVPCRTPSGLYHLVPWRLAKWLRHVLPAQESVVRRTAGRIEQWRAWGATSASANGSPVG